MPSSMVPPRRPNILRGRSIGLLAACVLGSMIAWSVATQRKTTTSTAIEQLASQTEAVSSSPRSLKQHPLSAARRSSHSMPSCRTADDCGASHGCRDGQCSPCFRSLDCAHGELCVTGSCIPSQNASCVSDSDCPGFVRCTKTSPGGGIRGNADQRSFCLPYGGTTPVAQDESAPAVGIQSQSTLSDAISEALSQ